jgi:hypothetical protein
MLFQAKTIIERHAQTLNSRLFDRSNCQRTRTQKLFSHSLCCGHQIFEWHDFVDETYTERFLRVYPLAAVQHPERIAERYRARKPLSASATGQKT